ncbi:MAG: VCBS repeat-containing protein [Elusimicrobia bacterium]|nr:VCBS repeat-containing protein [Elusimicrobiota bacterium]
MKIRRTTLFLTVLGGLPLLGADYFFGVQDQDATIISDQWKFDQGIFEELVSVGDFNGDGTNDLAIHNSSEQELSVVFGRPFQTVSIFNNVRSFYIDGRVNLLAPIMGDINGDRYDDLVMVSLGYVYVIYGSSSPSPSRDIETANIRFTGNIINRVIVGNFDGDEFDDIAVGYFETDSRQSIKIYFGNSSPDPVIDLSSQQVVSVVLKSPTWSLSALKKGRFSRPNADDLVVEAIDSSNGFVLVLGTGTWPMVWDLGGSASPQPIMAHYSRGSIFEGTVRWTNGESAGME